ncbi:MAG TPA: amidase family protein, partial [Rhodothermia bacterium]
HDKRDSTSAPVPVPNYSEARGEISGLRIGLPREYFAEGLDEGIRSTIDDLVQRFRRSGAEIVDVSLPHTPYGIATYYILATAEASSNLARYDGVRYGHRADVNEVERTLSAETEELETVLREAQESGRPEAVASARKRLDRQDSLLQRLYSQTRAEGFGDEVKRRIMLGTYVLSTGYYDAYYSKAQRVRRLISDDFKKAFESVDVLLTPATPSPAFKIGEKVDDPLEMYLSDVYTVTANLAGIPGLVVPLGRHPDTPHLPIAAQLLGKAFDEATLFRVGRAIEGLSGSSN